MNQFVNTDLIPWYIGAAFLLLPTFGWIHNKLTPSNRVSFKGNPAARTKYIFAWVGCAIAMFGSLVMSNEAFKTDLFMFGLDTLVVIVTFAFANFLFDKAILWKVDNNHAINEGNKAVALVETCAYVALGLIMCASFAGGGLNWAGGLMSAVAFSFLGLATLAAAYFVYAVSWKARCDIDAEIGKGCKPAAIDAGSLLLGMGIVLFSAIVGDFTGWVNDFLSYFEAAGIGIVVVAIGRVLLTLPMRRNRSTREAHHGSMAKSATVGLVTIALSIATSGLIFFYV
jgi:uncharacterized membrane protein YjfL (UPF0719 family)